VLPDLTGRIAILELAVGDCPPPHPPPFGRRARGGQGTSRAAARPKVTNKLGKFFSFYGFSDTQQPQVDISRPATEECDGRVAGGRVRPPTAAAPARREKTKQKGGGTEENKKLRKRKGKFRMGSGGFRVTRGAHPGILETRSGEAGFREKGITYQPQCLENSHEIEDAAHARIFVQPHQEHYDRDER